MDDLKHLEKTVVEKLIPKMGPAGRLLRCIASGGGVASAGGSAGVGSTASPATSRAAKNSSSGDSKQLALQPDSLYTASSGPRLTHSCFCL